jgi:hypothetical protein
MSHGKQSKESVLGTPNANWKTRKPARRQNILCSFTMAKMTEQFQEISDNAPITKNSLSDAASSSGEKRGEMTTAFTNEKDSVNGQYRANGAEFVFRIVTNPNSCHWHVTLD